MVCASQNEMVDVHMECDSILLDYFGGVASEASLRRAADGMMHSLKSYDRGPDFGRLVVREFNKRAAELKWHERIGGNDVRQPVCRLENPV